ncbi:DMT family transporter [Pseudoxanthomonas putridarboris]|uniref:DMT family transporter n=1 Tax=Pseudoxanthomonas putridarboris TaxID=752605 RepID=A0ABU9J1I3_9GAMM
MPAIPTHFRAALLMLGSTVLFALMVVAIRLASQTLHTFEIAFFRNFFGLLAALPLLFRHGPGFLKTDQFPRYLFRCVIGICSMLAGFWAIGHLPLAQAVSLSYSTPIFVTLAAAALLNEKVRARRWSAVILGFIGVLVIVRPGSAEFSVDALIAVLAAVMSAIVAIQIKQLSHTEPADRIVIYTTLLWVPMSLLPALAVWEWPRGIAWVWVVAAGFLGTGGHMLWTRALKQGEVSALTPISFMQLPVVAIFGWWLFGEGLDRWTLVGAGIIFGANAYIAHREAVLSRKSASEAASSAAKPGE